MNAISSDERPDNCAVIIISLVYFLQNHGQRQRIPGFFFG